MFYLMVSDLAHNQDYDRWYWYLGLNAGTILGVSLMLARMKVGLYLYSIFQATYLAYVMYVTVGIYGDAASDSFWAPFVHMIMFAFLFSSTAFLVMFWLPTNTRHLK